MALKALLRFLQAFSSTKMYAFGIRVCSAHTRQAVFATISTAGALPITRR